MPRWHFIKAPPPPPPPPPPPTPPPPPPPPPDPGPISCFLGDMAVHMADGRVKRMDQIKVGDEIRGGFGDTVNKVQAVELTYLGNRNMYRINDDFLLSGEHPLWVPSKGWSSPEPEWMAKDWGNKHTIIVDNAYSQVTIDYHAAAAESEMKKLWKRVEVGDEAAVFSGDRLVRINSIELLDRQWPVWTPIFTLVCSNGTGAMVLGHEGFWCIAWANPEFPYRDWLKK